MISALLSRASLRATSTFVVASSTVLGPALSTYVTRCAYTPHSINYSTMSKDHTFDVNDVKKHFDAIKNKHPTEKISAKLDTEAFKPAHPFDVNEPSITAARIAEEVEKKRVKVKSPEVYDKQKKSAPIEVPLDTEAFKTQNAFDANETFEKATRLAEQAKPFHPTPETFDRDAFVTENPFDANETWEKAIRAAEQAAKIKDSRSS